MAFSDELAERIRQRLARRKGIEEKKMFGGVGFLPNGNPTKYGWALHFDAEGRIALVPVASDEYTAFVAGEGVATVLTAMRNQRA
jgi:hypothetical protein